MIRKILCRLGFHEWEKMPSGHYKRKHPRRDEALKLICEGQTVKEVAEAMGIKPNGVRRHIELLKAEYKVRGLRELIIKKLTKGE